MSRGGGAQCSSCAKKQNNVEITAQGVGGDGGDDDGDEEGGGDGGYDECLHTRLEATVEAAAEARPTESSVTCDV